MPAVFEAFSVH